MSRSLQIAVTLVCLTAVLTIFIAPSIEMPETVLRVHHTVTAASTQGGGAVGLAASASFHTQHRTTGSGHSSRITRSVGLTVRKVSTVLRC